MKHHLSAIAIGLACGAFSALAADSIGITQGGGGNTIDASQTGNPAAGARAIAIQQDGNDNEITVLQKNIQGVGLATVNQTDNRNIAKIEQSDSTDVVATITQSMDNNNATILQNSVRNAVADINQSHGEGIASIVQNMGSTDVQATIVNSHPNQSFIKQSNVNVGSAYINDENGVGNWIDIVQHDGSNLVATIITLPGGNVRQNFARVTQTGSYQTASIELGGNTMDSFPTIDQDGTQNDAGILQSGGIFNTADIFQTGLGGLNVARIAQTGGGGNRGSITQNGSNYNASLNQSGDSLKATISQHY
jgi:hypothetical protein